MGHLWRTRPLAKYRRFVDSHLSERIRVTPLALFGRFGVFFVRVRKNDE